MKSFNLTLILAILTVAWAPHISHAQEIEQVTLQFVSFPLAAKPEPVELIVEPGKTILVDLPTNSLSKEYKVNKNSNWILGKSSIDAEGKPTFETYGSTASLASKKQLVLVTRKGINHSDGLTLIALDCDSTGFKGGSYFIFNATKLDIAATLGETKIALKPRAHTLVNPKPSKTEGERNYLYTYLYFRKGAEAIPFYTSTWRYSKKARAMVFIYHEPINERLKTHTIRDYLTD
jgi:hypothetical protein